MIKTFKTAIDKMVLKKLHIFRSILKKEQKKYLKKFFSKIFNPKIKIMKELFI